MNTKLLGFIALIAYSTSLLAYDANCKLDNGKQFNIVVKKKVMVVDYKYKVFYKGKSQTGWYEYENRSYKYVVGEFNNGKFPIEVTNKYSESTSAGTCYFN